MYLSRIKPSAGFMLSQLESKAHTGDVYAQHQLLWEFFPNMDSREFLYRYEQSQNGPCYYVLSGEKPDANSDAVACECKPFNPQLSEGDVLAYSLRANPTKMLKSVGAGKRGKRVDVLMHAKKLVEAKKLPTKEVEAFQLEAAREWLTEPERQGRWGLEFISQPEVTEHLQHRTYKRKGSEDASIQFSSVNYTGLLRVKDPQVFVAQLSKGFGRAKAMGCGLMLIRRAG